MYTFLLTIHVAACILLILVVLLQAGRGAGLAVFGGGGGDIFTTPTSTSFMKQMTSGLAITFAITSLLLTLISGRAGMRSVTNTVNLPPPPVQETPQPAAPKQTSQPAAHAKGAVGTTPVKK